MQKINLLSGDLLQSPVTSPSSHPNILLSSLVSNNPILCFSLTVRSQVSQPYITTGKTAVHTVETKAKQYTLGLLSVE
jgi:hypothetical protein